MSETCHVFCYDLVMEEKNWLAMRREQLKISQENLVDLLADYGFTVSRSSISQWENGKFHPPLEDPHFRRALANALQMTIPDMLGLAGYEVQSDFSSESMRAAYIIEQLPPQERDFALKLLEQVLQKAKA